MDSLWIYVLWGFGAYLLGSISFGDVVARIIGVQIRDMGTGNPGAANMFREVGPRYGALVLALDLAKGLAVTLPAFLLDLPWAALAGVSGALAGHFAPVFWRFRGGTGMAAAMGMAFGLVPAGALIAAPVALITLRLSKNSGVSGALFFLLAVAAGWLIHREPAYPAIVLASAAAVLIKSRIQYR